MVIRIAGTYFSVRQPDSGLIIPKYYREVVANVTLNPTQIDIKRVTSTIAQVTFKLLDRNMAISNLIQGDASRFLGQEVEIWIGRSGVSMPFSDYGKLQKTVIQKVDYVDGAYTFSASENTDRINRPIYRLSTKLNGEMLAAATSFIAQDDISDFPTAGMLKIDNEVMSYASKDDATRTFSGLVRGEFSTTPADHDASEDVFLAETVTANPLTLALQLLTSGGGGSAYDVLDDGVGLDQALIDIDGIEDLRDASFPDLEFKLLLSNIDSALKFIETEIFTPLRLRFTTSSDPTNAKLTIKQSDPIAIREPDLEINDDSIRPSPRWVVDANQIINRIEVEWDYSEDTGKYLKRSIFEDADSIETYGTKTLTYRFKGVVESLDGEAVVEEFGERMLGRLASPTPEITVTTHADKSLLNVLDRPLVETSKVPNYDGSLNFANELEIVSRGINFLTGDVNFKLLFNSGTFNRFPFIAPADSFVSAASTSEGTLGAGRGDEWLAGWKVRLWDNDNLEYTADEVNTIEEVNGDVITFADAWATDIAADPTRYRLKFADYDEVSEDQKRYGFISETGSQVFYDGKRRYVVAL